MLVIYLVLVAIIGSSAESYRSSVIKDGKPILRMSDPKPDDDEGIIKNGKPILRIPKRQYVGNPVPTDIDDDIRAPITDSEESKLMYYRVLIAWLQNEYGYRFNFDDTRTSLRRNEDDNIESNREESNEEAAVKASDKIQDASSEDVIERDSSFSQDLLRSKKGHRHRNNKFKKHKGHGDGGDAWQTGLQNIVSSIASNLNLEQLARPIVREAARMVFG